MIGGNVVAFSSFIEIVWKLNQHFPVEEWELV